MSQKPTTTPLYLQVYKELLKRIENGIYEVNDMLPSEAELQKEFSVSRITIRRSLQDLELAGYIKISRGKGAHVLPHRQYTNLVGASSFSQEAVKSGERPSSIILDFHEMKASGIICEYLQVNEGDDIYYLKRLRLKNGRIIGMNETYISKKFGLIISDQDLDEKTSIYALYEKHGESIERAVETIEAQMPSSSMRNELYMSEGEPVFRRERITYGSNNLALEFSINTYKANEYKYVIQLKKG
ncbi:GntR family transcriptional regulator [Breznakia sp. PF5-3]|uniref:GntR family transcriptional regulator n=1 Tax=unclassified Breznakia TaxID=2623764 RepID=UPI002406D772|nr:MULTISPECIES: GntR family transcriptional regulator [unclassified Breznakia]MDF9824751.1 GntR family transcriptional regulator [Breznakia sp. PM6-1]MDF9835682.1 GntR family transcriptional regulator [Breznakia sp. PF5-3]MDF9837731.1 GntR family transcriptional regulator [Breznakia sp. PFB2-8]MDF9859692.1 GntR family transcriptional regulator [Breznakia sp. PH5-24]